ncbi:histone deacetylase [Roseiconus nitratireducens]|uniref:Histone deacetylase n=1 Tax=Roseiconus nitratireducens TaxID=2605748 RepID=A0A5M6D6A5_9BACT|nr:histone deacetylase [Roseiconus nitratireducens]KAA5543067.1 histone deacetylase [Roseiconus nitratireducens]
MTLLYSDEFFLQHETGGHPENAGRLRAVTARLQENKLDQRCTRPVWKSVSHEQLMRVHDKDQIDAVESLAEMGGGMLDPDTIVSRRSYDVAKMAAGAACDAVRRVVAGEDKTALCLVRPPGHHATDTKAMGFCLMNNIAVAARFATTELDLDRVMIVDWDVHHGNGTQDIFWEDPHVGFLSMHRFPFYPGSGTADETGGGAGKGTTVNLPIRFGTARQDQLKGFRAEVEALADKIKPQLILVSAGFDSHVDDPIGSLELESEDFSELTQIVLDVAKTHADGRVVSILEGGYNPVALGESVECHLEKLLE